MKASKLKSFLFIFIVCIKITSLSLPNPIKKSFNYFILETNFNFSLSFLIFNNQPILDESSSFKLLKLIVDFLTSIFLEFLFNIEYLGKFKKSQLFKFLIL